MNKSSDDVRRSSTATNVIITVFILMEALSSTDTVLATSAGSLTTHVNPTVKCRNGKSLCAMSWKRAKFLLL